VTPRRVLMTADAVGGVWTYAVELARGLAARGTETLLAVIGPEPGAAQRAEAAGVAGLSLEVTGLALEWHDRAGPLTPAQARRLVALENGFRPDLVHCNSFREAAAGFKAPVLVVAHSCVATWWRACRGEGMPGDRAGYARGVRAGLDAAAAVAAPTGAFLGAFREAWGPVRRPRVVWNGLDLEPVPAVTGRQPIILAAGRLWDEAKNVAALARVAPALPWPVHLVGEPPQNRLLGAGVRHLGHLPRSELRRRMARAAIFAAPARYEPFGLAVLEAAAAGCALVLGRQASLVELWGDAARFVPAGDPGALRDALLDLIADPEALARLGRAARVAAARHGRRRMVDGYLAAYAELLPTSVGARAA
jgi:glycosyltransferase involved in cell wall biosynthesis